MEIGSMPSIRSLSGLWLIAAYFAAKSCVLLILVLSLALSVGNASSVLAIMREVLPLLTRLDASPQVSVVLALSFAMFGVALSVSIVTRKKWAAAYVVLYHGIAVVRFLLAILFLKSVGWGVSSRELSSRYMQVEILASLLMVAYLLHPEVRRAFGFTGKDI